MRAFTSTRANEGATLEQAVLRGVPESGGLYVPDDLGVLPAEVVPLEDFPTFALWMAPHVLPELPRPELDAIVGTALDFPVSLVEVDTGHFVLELFHGPTGAFKDIGARMLCAITTRVPAHPMTVLVATSGDTGGAIAHAFRGATGVRVVVLFPHEGVSERQRRQMTTLGDNVHAVAVTGTFDDCQGVVRAAFADEGCRARYGLLSGNSINVGRLLPQTIYYGYAAALVDDPEVVFVVPSGNLGNVCAGLIAKRMGARIGRFVAATNINRSLGADFEPVVAEPATATRTLSSAMDVTRPSNLERIRWLYAGQPDAMRRDIAVEVVDDDETRSCIEAVHRRTGYVLDPHSAVAYAAALRHHSDGSPIVSLATAHPSKFPEVVEAAIGRPVPVPPRLAAMMSLEERVYPLDPTLPALNDLLESL